MQSAVWVMATVHVVSHSDLAVSDYMDNVTYYPNRTAYFGEVTGTMTRYLPIYVMLISEFHVSEL